MAIVAHRAALPPLRAQHHCRRTPVRDRTGQFRDSRSLRSALTNKHKLAERGLVFMALGTYLTIPKLRRAASPPSHREVASSALLTWRNYLTQKNLCMLITIFEFRKPRRRNNDTGGTPGVTHRQGF